MLRRIRIHIKLLSSGVAFGGLGAAALLLAFVFLMVPSGFVEELRTSHVEAIYGIGFPLVAVFLYSQLFAEDLEENVLRWLLSLPIRGWKLFVERWVICTAVLLLVYFASLFAVDKLLIELPWHKFAGDILVPAIWLGQLALLVSLAGRRDAAGIAAGLFYWVLESLSRGALTGKLYLFLTASAAGGDDLAWNRTGLWLLALAALLASMLVMRSKRYFIR